MYNSFLNTIETMVDQERVERFIKMLKFGKPEERTNVIREINQLKDPSLLPFLMEIVHGNENDIVKQAAIRSLRNIGDISTIKVLIDLAINDLSKEVRMEAIRTLGLFKNHIAIDPLTKIVNRSDDEEIIQLASKAIQVLQGISPEYTIE